jgi:monoamine oxidase
MSIVDVFVTGWSSEPYTGGAYSTLGVGATPADRSALTEVLDGRFTFAGEHLSIDYPATMHGAYNTGVEAAKRLLAAQPTAKTAVIVGAGLSGLAAAQTLRNAGLAVTVLEATSQPGGRARTQLIWDSRTIHPGAAWIHGDIGNPIAELARSVHIGFPPEPPQTQHIVVSALRTVDGANHFGPAVALSSTDADQVLAVTHHVHDELSRVAEVHRNSGKPDEAVRSTLEALLSEVDHAQTRKIAATQLMQHFESLLAGSVDDLSLHHGDEPYAYPGGDHYLTTPLEPLIQTLTTGLNLVLESPVTDVSSDTSSVHIASLDRHSADVAVIAVPLIPLQRGAITFTPQLPEALHASLHRLRMGSKTKVFVRFTEKWWGETHTIWVYPSASTTNPGTQAEPTGVNQQTLVSPLWPEWVDASDVAGAPTLFCFVSGVEGQRIAELGATPHGLELVRAELENLFAAIQPALIEGRASNQRS